MSLLIFLTLCVLSLLYAAYWSRRARSLVPLAFVLGCWITAFVLGCMIIAMQ